MICSFRAQLSAPLPQVWEFIIDPRNMHLWASATRPVTGIDRPLQPGDVITQSRTRFFRHSSQQLLVEVVVPNHFVRVREMSPKGRKMNVTATVSVEEAGSPGATLIEESISYSLGDSPFVRWADRWLVNPLFQALVRWKTRQGFRRLADLLDARLLQTRDRN